MPYPRQSEEMSKDRAPLAPHNFARLVLTLIGVVWLAVGVPGLLSPEWLADWVDFELQNDLAKLEFRAMYGGLSIALAALHLAAATRKALLAPALVAASTLLIGLAGGRIFAVALDGMGGLVGLILLLSEIGMVVLAGLALFRLRQGGAPPESDPAD